MTDQGAQERCAHTETADFTSGGAMCIRCGAIRNPDGLWDEGRPWADVKRDLGLASADAPQGEQCITHDWQVTDTGIWIGENGQPAGAWVRCSKGDSDLRWIGLMPKPSSRTDAEFAERIEQLTKAREAAWTALNSPEARAKYGHASADAPRGIPMQVAGSDMTPEDWKRVQEQVHNATQKAQAAMDAAQREWKVVDYSRNLDTPQVIAPDGKQYDLFYTDDRQELQDRLNQQAAALRAEQARREQAERERDEYKASMVYWIDHSRQVRQEHIAAEARVERLTEALREMVARCEDCGGTGTAIDYGNGDKFPCSRCDPARAALTEQA